MFKKCFRLNTSDFKEVFNFGKTNKTSLFLIKRKNNALGYARFAVVVSKKISKKAVQRNYLKRKFFNIIKENLEHIPVADYIFILNSEIKDIQYKDLLNNFKHINF